MNMDLEQQWKNMGTAEDTHGKIDFFIPGSAEIKKTASPLYKIKKSLQVGMVWIVVLLLVYLAGAIVFKPLFTRLSLLILAVYSVYCFIESVKLNKQINPSVISGNSVKAELERHYQSMTQWCKTQERNAVFLYPVSILGGAMLGLSADGVEKMNRVMQKPALWIFLAVLTIILVPVLKYLTKRMMKVAYYKHIAHLKQLIDSLNE